MNHTSSTTHGTLHDGLVSVLLAFDFDVLVQRDSAKPIVAVIFTSVRLSVDMDSRYIGQQILVLLLHVLMVGDMVVSNSHLATTDAGTDIAHTVVEAYLLVLIVRVTLTVLSDVHHKW